MIDPKRLVNVELINDLKTWRGNDADSWTVLHKR